MFSIIGSFLFLEPKDNWWTMHPFFRSNCGLKPAQLSIQSFSTEPVTAKKSWLNGNHFPCRWVGVSSNGKMEGLFAANDVTRRVDSFQQMSDGVALGAQGVAALWLTSSQVLGVGTGSILGLVLVILLGTWLHLQWGGMSCKKLWKLRFIFDLGNGWFGGWHFSPLPRAKNWSPVLVEFDARLGWLGVQIGKKSNFTTSCSVFWEAQCNRPVPSVASRDDPRCQSGWWLVGSGDAEWIYVRIWNVE